MREPGEIAGPPASSLPVREAQAGDRSAQRALFDRFQRGVMSYCLLASNGDRDRALDLTQEVFTRAFRGLASLAEPQRFQGWLFTIAANVCRTRGTEESRRRQALETFALEVEAAGAPNDAAERERRIARVRRILEQLPDPKLRAIVQLKYGEPEHTTREIAERLAIPHGTVTVKLMRFRAAAKRELVGALLDEAGTEVQS